MRAKRIAGLLLVALFFAAGAAAGPAGGLRLTVGPGPQVTAAQSAPPSVPGAPAERAEGLEYLPRGEGRGGGGVIGWLLIAAAVVLAIIIVIFVVRHRRVGRPG